ncbi:acetyltransferase, ribosomal protein N-acetylase [Saccharomonospora marina XMU15]|uniref:Acetyltransferase, ribosomal protein N-acetylase n=1 Tax=Saccharomonospora marina XMU15 TaxID=882083 RepID=H5WYQ3_9PSEU|nr:GNAT family protein [Saccharomonospora marina]EHR50718.1 acetyltransferase, ribosomal protein N-acetylase [Saccharomonospora marina XMU15]
MRSPTYPAPRLRPQRSLPTLRTRRLTLRPISAGDLDHVHDYLSREDVCRYLLHEPLSRQEVAAKLVAAEQRSAMGGDGDFARLAVVRDEDGVVVGDVMLNIVSVEAATTEIGWVYSPDVSGMGYATEAARALLEYAFATLGAHRVIAQLHPDNTASSRLCQRLGMRHEALHRANLWIKDGWEDTSVHAILRHEWENRAGDPCR